MSQPNAYTDAGKSDAYGYGYRHSAADNANPNSDGNCDDASSFADTIGDPAAADTKAKANAVPSAYAVSEWVKS